MTTRTATRFWWYRIDEVWTAEGHDLPDGVEVGRNIVDRWKADRIWQFYKVPMMEPTFGFHAELLGKYEGPLNKQGRPCGPAEPPS